MGKRLSLLLGRFGTELSAQHRRQHNKALHTKSRSLSQMIQFPQFPDCSCEMHPPGVLQPEVPEDALSDPFAYLPPPVDFTDAMASLASRYRAHDIDWRYYPAFQAAAFLQPKTAEQHAERRKQFLSLKSSAESQGFTVPESLTKLYTTDAFIDRLHHNCVWPSLPEEIVRLPSNPDFAVFLFLIEGQACGIWHLLLAPDGSHTVITADARFGCIRGYPPGRIRDPATFNVCQCVDTLNRLLYQFFIDSAQHDLQYIRRLQQYFAETEMP